jgi:copper chaperone CopZ
VTRTIPVQAIGCEACEHAIRTVLGRTAGIHAVHCDRASGTVRVCFDENTTDEARMWAVPAGLGYEPLR